MVVALASRTESIIEVQPLPSDRCKLRHPPRSVVAIGEGQGAERSTADCGRPGCRLPLGGIQRDLDKDR